MGMRWRRRVRALLFSQTGPVELANPLYARMLLLGMKAKLQRTIRWSNGGFSYHTKDDVAVQSSGPGPDPSVSYYPCHHEQVSFQITGKSDGTSRCHQD